MSDHSVIAAELVAAPDFMPKVTRAELFFATVVVVCALIVIGAVAVLFFPALPVPGTP